MEGMLERTALNEAELRAMEEAHRLPPARQEEAAPVQPAAPAKTPRIPRHGPIKAVFEFPTDGARYGLRFEVDYDEERAERIRELAREFGLTTGSFLRKMLARKLPHQPRKLPELSYQSAFSFVI
jgi:hypothetical protein